MIDDENSYSHKFTTWRSDEKNARHPRCKPAFRRVCGVCVHFQGDLKTEGDRACAALLLTKRAKSDAGKCHRFERKSA